MTVYVESNFVLELAFLQEEHESCSDILEMAEAKNISLMLPAFSIGEPYETWVRRSKRRNQLRVDVSAELRELARSKPYQESSRELIDLTDLLLRSGEEEKHRLDDALLRILNIVEIIPTSSDTIRDALSLQTSRSLSAQDSIVYSSILQHLREAGTTPSCFITKDRDFVNPDIEADLTAFNCKVLSKFSDGLGYARSHLKSD